MSCALATPWRWTAFAAVQRRQEGDGAQVQRPRGASAGTSSSRNRTTYRAPLGCFPCDPGCAVAAVLAGLTGGGPETLFAQLDQNLGRIMKGGSPSGPHTAQGEDACSYATRTTSVRFPGRAGWARPASSSSCAVQPVSSSHVGRSPRRESWSSPPPGRPRSDNDLLPASEERSRAPISKVAIRGIGVPASCGRVPLQRRAHPVTGPTTRSTIRVSRARRSSGPEARPAKP